MDVNGTLIWYYNICKREVWLMNRNITPDQHDDNIDLGRFIHEKSYKRDEKEISFGNVKFDVMFHSKNQLIIGETKKSSRYSEASKWQLLFYLNVLETSGINAKGVLLYPEERKRVEVELNNESKEKLKEMGKQVEEICSKSYPPKFEKIRFCKRCAYREYCYA